MWTRVCHFGVTVPNCSLFIPHAAGQSETPAACGQLTSFPKSGTIQPGLPFPILPHTTCLPLFFPPPAEPQLCVLALEGSPAHWGLLSHNAFMTLLLHVF